MRRRALLLLAVSLGAACSQQPAIDTAAHLQLELDRLEAPLAPEVPFALSPELADLLDRTLKPAPRETYRVEQVLDLIFGRVGLQYALTPTRSAVATYHAREGNCLSFVNLFVAVGRKLRLNPFYVEVTDQQSWSYQHGMVVSQGHIVAGMYVGGQLRTYDFLPHRRKAYRSFAPIPDRTAVAHYYNNLGGEQLLVGSAETALPLLQTAVAVDPTFPKALNNLGVALARLGRAEEALAVYERGLQVAPEDVPLLTNQVRAYQFLGRHDDAVAALQRIESSRTTNPFFYLYKAEVALGAGDGDGALAYLREALRRDSELPEVHVGLVKAYMSRGELDKARHHLQRALRLDATHREALRLARLLEDHTG
jgi:tetratricopeptide (TPR) repeat protein